MDHAHDDAEVVCPDSGSAGVLPKYVILRCCRDWPIQIEAVYDRGGTCGLCGESPELIMKEYQSGQQAKG